LIHTLRQFARLLKISTILARYRLDEFLEATHLYRPMRLVRVLAPWATSKEMAGRPRGERLRLALTEMGPVFVKFGQIVSTRRDLVPADIADERAAGPVPPFPGTQAQAIVERELQQPVAELSRISVQPTGFNSAGACSSLRMVAVVVKVVRPGYASSYGERNLHKPGSKSKSAGQANRISAGI
jgi:ubiquinone biosynthesis protein